MDERIEKQKKIIPVELEIYALLINMARVCVIPCEVRESEDGEIITWTDIFSVYGTGNNLAESLSDMFEAMRASAQTYCDDFAYWYKKNPSELIYVLKVQMSTDEELLSCLAIKNYSENS